MRNNIQTLIKEGYSAKEASTILKIPVRRVHHLANTQGLNFLRKSKYSLDYERFSTKLHTEETYYLLGYLFSDGYINPNKGLINITSKDKSILEKLIKLIGDIPIRENKYESFYIQWYSKKHIKELENLGCGNNKSLTLLYPKWLKRNIEHHFIRGYFDGDGSIGLYNRKDRPSKLLKISIAGTLDFLSGIKECINNKGSIRRYKNIFILQYNGNVSAKVFCEKIYLNSNIFMERKNKVFKGFLQYRHIIETNK